MEKDKKPNGYYCKNKKRVLQLAATCKDFAEFRNKYPQVRSIAQTMGWIDDIKAILPHKTYWSRKTCEKEIREKGYKTKEDFREGSPGAHNWAYKHGILDELFAEFEAPGHYNRKKIYVYEFEDGYAYVGLTDNLDRREYQHKNEQSPVKEHMESTGLNPDRKILSDWLDKDAAQVYERETIKTYTAVGWKMLNSKRGGSLGRMRDLKYSMTQLMEAAATCQYRAEFKRKYPDMYNFVLYHHLKDEILGQMPTFHMNPSYWTEERIDEAFNACHRSKGELIKNNRPAYNAILKKGLQEKYFGGRKAINRGRTKESAIEEAQKYLSVSELAKKDIKLYQFICRNNLQEQCFSKMIYHQQHADYTWEDIEAAINVCSTLKQMREEHGHEYRAALRCEEWRKEMYRRLPNRGKVYEECTWPIIEAAINASQSRKQMREEHKHEYRAALRREDWRRELLRRLPVRGGKTN